jgi:cobalamin biosynthesis protein CobT
MVEYSKEQRQQGRLVLSKMKDAAGPTVSKLANRLRMAVKSMKQTMWVGALDDGDELDPDATPMIALGSSDPNVFRRQFKRLEESTFVCVLVDLSGSMGNNEPERRCPKHGASRAKKAQACSHKDSAGKKCGETLRYVSNNKAGQAAITAMALHESLRLCGIAHTVLGYRTGWSRAVNAYGGPTYWSRHSCAVETHIFVPAPGLSDDGAALPYITGGGCNADGESVMNAARYAAEKARGHDRMIMLVVADGLPSGADDPEIEGRHLKDQVERVADAGIEVYGVGVGIRDTDAFASYYPNVRVSGNRAATGHVLLDNVAGLSDTVLRRLTDLLLQSTGFARNESQKANTRIAR